MARYTADRTNRIYDDTLGTTVEQSTLTGHWIVEGWGLGQHGQGWRHAEDALAAGPRTDHRLCEPFQGPVRREPDRRADPRRRERCRLTVHPPEPEEQQR